MRKALVIGVNYYEMCSPLHGCVNDAYAVRQVLERHMDGSINFDVMSFVAVDAASKIRRSELREHVIELFNEDSDIALFYFAGHGYIDSLGGFLMTSECEHGHDGMSLAEVLQIANDSKAKNKILVLDSCHSGFAGDLKAAGGNALLSEGMTILTASSKNQYADEINGSGVFTSLFVDAMNGGAANLLGEITPGSVYAHIDQSLGAWDQRPIFKTNVKTFTSLRKVVPPITLADLKKIGSLFPDPGYQFPLDPSFEPQPPAPNHGIAPDPANNDKFAVLQKLNRLNLVKPIGEDHMYFAAMNSKACHLTALGAHYWNLIHDKRI